MQTCLHMHNVTLALFLYNLQTTAILYLGSMDRGSGKGQPMKNFLLSILFNYKPIVFTNFLTQGTHMVKCSPELVLD